jgi:lysozyme
MPSAELIEDLKKDEGLRLRAYRDTVGIWTVGYGHAHVAPGTVWTEAEAEAQLLADIASAEHDCDAHIPWWRALDPARADVLCELMFNLGWPTFSDFHQFLGLVDQANYTAAADDLLATKAGRELPERYGRLATQLRTGVRA